MESNRPNKFPYNHEEIFRLEEPRLSSSGKPLTLAQLKANLKKNGTQNTQLAGYYADQFVFYVPSEDEGSVAQQLLRDNDGVIGATTIKGQGKTFFDGYEGDEIERRYADEINKKVEQKRTQLNKASRLSNRSTEEIAQEINEQIALYTNELKTYYQVKQRLDKAFTPALATAILEAYSQLPGYLVIRTVLNSIKATPPNTTPVLAISEIKPEDRDLALVEENGKVYLDVAYRNVSIQDTNTGNRVGVFPINTSARFELKKVKGKMAFEFVQAKIGNPDVMQMMSGQMMDEEELRKKYCPPEYEFHSLWKKLNDEINNESRNFALRERAIDVANAIKALVLLLIETDKTKSEYFKDLGVFNELIAEIIRAIKEPSSDSKLEYRILNIQTKIEHLLLKRIQSHHQRFMGFQGEMVKNSQLFESLNNSLFEFIEQRPYSLLSTSLSKISEDEVSEKISERVRTFDQFYREATEERSSFKEIEEDPVLKPIAVSNPTKLVKAEDIKNPNNELLVRMQEHDWINDSTDPEETAFYRDTVVSKGRLFVNQRSLTPDVEMKDKEKMDLLLSSLEKEFNLSGRGEAERLYDHLSKVHHQGMYSTFKLTMDSINNYFLEAHQSKNKAVIDQELKELTEYKDGLIALQLALREAKEEPLDKQMLKHPSLTKLPKVLLTHKPTELATNEELSALVATEKVTADRLIKLRQSELSFNLLTSIETTTNLTRSADGNFYLDVIFSDLAFAPTQQSSPLHIPGVLSFRYVLTNDGFKLETMQASNPLLFDIMMKSDEENAKNLINKLPAAQLDEDRNHHQAIAYSNYYIRQIWTDIERTYGSLPSESIFNNNKFNALKELTTQVLANPFDPTLVLAYKNFIVNISSAQPEFKKHYDKIESSMKLLVLESQLEEEKRTLDKVAKLTAALKTNPSESNVKEYLRLMSYVANFPDGEKLAQSMLKQLKDICPNVLQLVSVKHVLHLQPPSGARKYFADYLLRENVYNLKIRSNAYTQNLDWLNQSKEKYTHPRLEELKFLFSESIKRNNLDTWFDTVMLVAADDLFDKDGNVRKDVAAIISYPNPIKFDYSEEEKAELLKAYIDRFVVNPLKDQFTMPIHPRITRALNKLDEKVAGVTQFNQTKMNALELSLLEKVDTSNPKPLKDFISEYLYQRNRYLLKTTVDHHYEDTNNPQYISIKAQGRAILSEVERVKKLDYDVTTPQLVRSMMAVRNAIKDPNEENLQACINLGNQIGKRSAGRILGGLMLTMVGILTIPLVLLFPGMIHKSIDLIKAGNKMSGISAEAPKLREAPRLEKKQIGFFSRMRHYNIKHHLDQLVEGHTKNKELRNKK